MDTTTLNWPPVIERSSNPATPDQNDETLTNELVTAFATLVKEQVGGLISEGGVIEITSASELGNLLFSCTLGEPEDLPAIQRSRWALLNAALTRHYTGFRFSLMASATSSFARIEGSDHNKHFINYSPQ